MGESGHLDAWERRQAEQILARELQIAGEDVRLADMHLQELSGPNLSGAVPPDSQVASHQAQAARTRAHEAWRIATDRWVAFVKNGTIPEDLRLPRQAPKDPPP